MMSSSIKIGCETYTWQMPGEQYKGKLEHIMEICAKAGFAGIEPETSFMHHLEDPVLMQEVLHKYELDLAALVVVEDWLMPDETAEERERADKWIQFMSHFPDAILLLVQMPGEDRKNLRLRQNNLLSCVNAFATRAEEKGIICSYHPNSPEGSIYRTAEDYEILLAGLDEEVIGYCPDVGHMAKGGMDPEEIMRKYRSHINLVHYKDMYADGRWAPTGKGTIDFGGITQYLLDTDYQGWIIMEDECDESISDPDGVTMDDGGYADQVLRPMLS
ncbi:MAG: sugar phosphate isomerase/epimerase [Saprospiraceae bacterium]|nr:sugar phosphate isomerase/epimerase [Saprospiraceae bacterium]